MTGAAADAATRRRHLRTAVAAWAAAALLTALCVASHALAVIRPVGPGLTAFLGRGRVGIAPDGLGTESVRLGGFVDWMDVERGTFHVPGSFAWATGLFHFAEGIAMVDLPTWPLALAGVLVALACTPPVRSALAALLRGRQGARSPWPRPVRRWVLLAAAAMVAWLLWLPLDVEGRPDVAANLSGQSTWIVRLGRGGAGVYRIPAAMAGRPFNVISPTPQWAWRYQAPPERGVVWLPTTDAFKLAPWMTGFMAQPVGADVPLWPIPAALTVIAALRVRAHARSGGRLPCPRCGYDLHDLPASAKCPECGAERAA